MSRGEKWNMSQPKFKKKNKSKVICVVGHGPSLRKAGYGEQIDSYDTIIRMINCDWQNRNDYGRKYHIGIHCPAQKSFSQPRRKPEECYFIYYPRLWKDKKLGRRARLYKRKVWFEGEWLAGLWSNKHFSRGTAAALMAMKYYRPEKIVLAGMTKVCGDLRKNYREHHPVELDNAHKFWGNTNTHNWVHEGLILKQMAFLYGTELEFLECNQSN